jgi:hypothetical protein
MAVELMGVFYFSDGRMFYSQVLLPQAAFRSISKGDIGMKG